MAEAKWYAVHTYSGYENKVKTNIESTIENQGLQDKIFAVVVPEVKKEKIVMKKDTQVVRVIKEKLMPGYIFIKMIMDEDTWYVVRNTRGATGFVGPGSKAVALSDEEVASMKLELLAKDDMDDAGILGTGNESGVSFVEGDTVTVISGAWIGTQSVIKSINLGKKTVTIGVEVFGRETPVEIGFNEIKVERF